MRNIFLNCVILVVTFTWSSDVIAQNNKASATLLASSCNIVQQNVTSTGSSTIINEIDCRPEGPPEKSFRLRYLWLDSKTASILLGGRSPSSLKKVLSKEPQVIENEIYQSLKQIVEKFGVRKSSDFEEDVFGSDTFFGLEGEKIKGKNEFGAVPIKNSGFGQKTKELRKSLKLYDAEMDLIWPDIAALKTIVDTTKWPTDYKISYDTLSNIDFAADKKAAQNDIISCVKLLKPVKREEIANYWADMRSLSALAKTKYASVFSSYSVIDGAIKPEINRSIAAAEFFGRVYWPDDFVIAEGSVQGNESCSGFDLSFQAHVRQLFLLVAVLEPSGKTLDVERLDFLRDGTEGLKLRRLGQEHVSGPEGALSLQRGESVVIPLRIELRSYVAEHKRSQSLVTQSKIKNAPMDTFTLSGEENEGGNNDSFKTIYYLRKEKTAFRVPDSLTINKAYTFGPALDLQSIVVGGGSKVALRNAPPNALSFIGGMGLGSCPFLYVSTRHGDAPASLGRILIGAHSKKRQRSQTIFLPQDAESVTVSEEEPEVTFLSSISVKDTGSGLSKELGRNIAIMPGSAYEIKIPKEYSANAVMQIEGYYQTIGNILADRSEE